MPFIKRVGGAGPSPANHPRPPPVEQVCADSCAATSGRAAGAELALRRRVVCPALRAGRPIGGPPAAAERWGRRGAPARAAGEGPENAVVVVDGTGDEPGPLSTMDEAVGLASAEQSAVAREALEAAVARLGAGGADPAASVADAAGEASAPKEGFSFLGMDFQGSLKGMLLLNLGAALFGCNQVVIKEAEEILSPASLNALRFVVAGACFAPAAVRGFRNPDLRKAAAELGAYLFLGYSMQAVGLGETSAARSAVTGTFTVLTVPFLVGTLGGRSIPVSTWLAALGSVVGVSLLVGDPQTMGANWGDAWCVGSAVLFGVHKFRTESVTTRFSDLTSELMAVQLAVLAGAACVFAAPEVVGVVREGGLDGLVAAAGGVPWVAVLWMGLATTALTLYIEVEALKEVSAPLAALIYTSEPLWGALLAYLVLGERWGPTGWIGAGIILTGTLYSQLSGDTVEKAET